MDLTPEPHGYLVVDREWPEGDQLTVVWAKPVRILMADSRVWELADRAALARGSLEFCAEKVGNAADLRSFSVNPLGPTMAEFLRNMTWRTVRLTVEGHRVQRTGSLYPTRKIPAAGTSVPVVLVP